MLSERRPWREVWFPNAEWVLLVALAAEIAIFAAIGPNFFTWANFFEVIRLSVELGLLALALTPVILTGGIDLSVGSMMGLAAVVFGAAWRDGHLSIPAAAALVLALGAAGGALNALLITRLKIPPLSSRWGPIPSTAGSPKASRKARPTTPAFRPRFCRSISPAIFLSRRPTSPTRCASTPHSGSSTATRWNGASIPGPPPSAGSRTTKTMTIISICRYVRMPRAGCGSATEQSAPAALDSRVIRGRCHEPSPLP